MAGQYATGGHRAEEFQVELACSVEKFVEATEQAQNCLWKGDSPNLEDGRRMVREQSGSTIAEGYY